MDDLTKAEQWESLKKDSTEFARQLKDMPDMIKFIKQVNESFTVQSIKGEIR